MTATTKTAAALEHDTKLGIIANLAMKTWNNFTLDHSQLAMESCAETPLGRLTNPLGSPIALVDGYLLLVLDLVLGEVSQPILAPEAQPEVALAAG